MLTPETTCLSCFRELNEPKGICPYCGCNNATIANEAHQLEAGSILAGTYLIGKVLGQGGFGITYVGWDLNLEIKVAIKEYYPEGCVTRDTHTHVTVLTYAGAKDVFFQKGKERFVGEARSLAKFSGDSGVVGVRAFFYENGTAYIVMDFVDGETLKAYAARVGGKLPSAQVLSMFQPLIRSLARVHESGLLHRDISPDNIMLKPDGTLALLDFGAARQISVAGEHSNTINVKHGFAPEEQYRTRGEQGPWTDVYALCATIYRLTTGVTPTEALDRMANDEPLAPPNAYGADFSPEQEAALMHGLALRANARTRDLRQLTAELYQSTDAIPESFAKTKSEKKHTKKVDNVKEQINHVESERHDQILHEKIDDRVKRPRVKKSWPYISLALLCIVSIGIVLIANARAQVANVPISAYIDNMTPVPTLEAGDSTNPENISPAVTEEPIVNVAGEKVKIGIILVGDENTTYDVVHIDGINAAAAEVGIPESNIVWMVNITEDERSYDAAIDLVEQGCNYIFSDSYGHQPFMEMAASEHPDVTFIALNGDSAALSGLPNFKNAFPHTFESRYVSGVVAGMKLKELMDTGEAAKPLVGYIGTYPYAEVVSGYTAFFLGIRSIVPEAQMDVLYTNSWYDPTAEAEAANALVIAYGAHIIGQHSDSFSAPSTVQVAQYSNFAAYCVGFNVDMLSVAPTAALTSAQDNWACYYTYAFKAALAGEDIVTDWSEGYTTGANMISMLGPSCAAGTEEKVAEVEAAIRNGSLNVFDTATFTVGGVPVTNFLALDTDGDWINDTGEAIENGIFYESKLRSAPYFSLRIDGITELNN